LVDALAGELLGGGHGGYGALASIAPIAANGSDGSRNIASDSLFWFFLVRRRRCGHWHACRIAALPGGCRDEADILPQRRAEDIPALGMRGRRVCGRAGRGAFGHWMLALRAKRGLLPVTVLGAPAGHSAFPECKNDARWADQDPSTAARRGFQ